MKDNEKTKEQLVNELSELRSQNAAQEKSITENISAQLAAEELQLYAENIVETIRQPLLVLDGDLKVISSNRNFSSTFEVTPSETLGCFIYDLGNKQWDIPALRMMLEKVLPEKQAFDDFEVVHNFRDIGHKIMLLNAREIYRKDIGARIILLAIEDITKRREIENGLEKTRKELAVIKMAADEVSEYAESLINTVREPLIALDQDLRVVTVSRSFYNFFKVKPEDTVGQLIYDLGNRQWDIPKLRELLEDILPEKATFDNYEVEHDFATIGRRTMLLNARQIQRVLGKKRVILLAIEDITERKRMEEEIIALSITDPLTSLHNRRGFLSLADQQLKLSDRNKRGMQLYFADLDGLKWINDTLGHEEGDKALIEAATVFKETFRTSDIIARLGGDEYAALAVDITDQNSQIFTARLQSLIDVQNSQENRRYKLSISIGSSYFDPENPCSLDELMAHADQLMYEQKQKKKNLLPQDASLSNSNH